MMITLRTSLNAPRLPRLLLHRRQQILGRRDSLPYPQRPGKTKEPAFPRAPICDNNRDAYFYQRPMVGLRRFLQLNGSTMSMRTFLAALFFHEATMRASWPLYCPWSTVKAPRPLRSPTLPTHLATLSALASSPR